MTPTEKAIRDFCGHHADWWPSTTQVQEMLALAQPEQEPVAWMYSPTGALFDICPNDADEGEFLPLYLAPPESNQFKPDWNTEAVLVEEMQRMAKRIEELEAMLERQTARIVDLQTHIENFDGEDR